MNDFFSFIALVSFHGIFGTSLVSILPGSLTYVLTQTLTYVLKQTLTYVLKLYTEADRGRAIRRRRRPKPVTQSGTGRKGSGAGRWGAGEMSSRETIEKTGGMGMLPVLSVRESAAAMPPGYLSYNVSNSDDGPA
jgi:hypothetical protein